MTLPVLAFDITLQTSCIGNELAPLPIQSPQGTFLLLVTCSHSRDCCAVDVVCMAPLVDPRVPDQFGRIGAFHAINSCR